LVKTPKVTGLTTNANHDVSQPLKFITAPVP
jgi:hypothetical protein